jgi:methyl-accepting chemotaxis protein
MSTISSRMVAGLAALLICTMALAVTAWVALSRQSAALDRLYANEIVPLRNLKIISDRFAVDVVDATHKVRATTMKPEAGMKAVEAALRETEKLWADYLTLPKSPAEQQIVAETSKPLAEARKTALQGLELMKGKDLSELDVFSSFMLYTGIDPGTEMIGKLIDLKLEEARIARDTASDLGSLAKTILLGASLLTLLLCAGVMAYILRGVIAPLKHSIGTMDALASATVGSGSNGTERIQSLEEIAIEGAERRDEIGEMAKTLLTFKSAGIERQRLRLAAEAEQQAREARAARVEAIIREFEAVATDVVAAVATSSAELEASAKSMMEVAKTASEQSTLVAAASHQASQSVQSLAATGDELAASIGEIGRQAEQSSAYAAAAAEKASATDQTVARLNEAGKAIVEVVDLIKSIAGQTNLLALNATIEAARAGEAGKGFAVVASEVKALAGQTTRATDIISEHVMAIQHASGESIEAMREIGRMIGEINQVAAGIAVAVTEQSQATQGIAENVQQVAQGTEHASESIAVVNEAAANTGAAASQVLSASEELARQGEMMREKVDWFLGAVRAA